MMGLGEEEKERERERKEQKIVFFAKNIPHQGL